MIGRIFTREKKAKTVGDLVGLPPARVTAMRRAHEAAAAGARESIEQSVDPSPDREQLSQESAAATTSAAGEAPQVPDSHGTVDQMAPAAQQVG
ncbi:MAG: hypothetical protein GX610_12640 [Rhodococcus sp.]|nr:hypothetical protein [Rhodococcus sp. (in: high G+C Gram-positive bacteria)]